MFSKTTEYNHRWRFISLSFNQFNENYFSLNEAQAMRDGYSHIGFVCVPQVELNTNANMVIYIYLTGSPWLQAPVLW